MRTVSGGIIGSSLIIFFIGASGLLKVCLRYISPLTVSANIAVVALSLYSAGFNGVGACVQLGIPMIFFLILFSQVWLFSSCLDMESFQPDNSACHKLHRAGYLNSTIVQSLRSPSRAACPSISVFCFGDT